MEHLENRIHASRWPRSTMTGLALAFLVVILRLPNILHPRQFDVDESQMLSQAMKLLVDPVPWRSVDGTSGGPLNSYLIWILLRIGFQPSYVLVHALAAVLVALQVWVAFLVVSRLTSIRVAAFAVSPMIVTYGLAWSGSFLHYSSELFPCLLLACSFLCLLKWLENRHPGLLVLCGALISAAPWCKLQAAAIAGILVLAFGWVIGRKPGIGWFHWTTLGWFGSGLLLPAVAIVVPVVMAGAGSDMVRSYVLGNIAYAGSEPWLKTLADAVLVNFAVFQVEPLMLILVTTAVFYRFGRMKGAARNNALDPRLLGIAMTWLAAAFFAIARPATMWPHYVNFLIFPAVCCLGLMLAGMPPVRQRRLLEVSALVGVIPLVLNLIFYVSGIQVIRQESAPQAPAYERIAHVVDDLRRAAPIDSLAIWGWEPGVYVVTGIPPATRDAIGHFVIAPSSMQHYFRARFLADLRRHPPDLFIDTVVRGALVWAFSEKDRYETDLELRRFIDANYQLVDELKLEPGGNSVRFFRRLVLAQGQTNARNSRPAFRSTSH